jgi:hypothetical protein
MLLLFRPLIAEILFLPLDAAAVRGCLLSQP